MELSEDSYVHYNETSMFIFYTLKKQKEDFAPLFLDRTDLRSYMHIHFQQHSTDWYKNEGKGERKTERYPAKQCT